MRMTLRQLSVFVAVATEGTVTKAADAVKLTQSAASMALSDLEGGLGAPLFDRVGKRLQLNDLGIFLLPKALQILELSEDFERTARGQHQSVDLKLGATLTISDFIMPELMADFLQNNADAQLRLQVGNTASIIEAVGNFQLDVGFIEGSCSQTQLTATPWQEDELCIACAPTHPLALKQKQLKQQAKQKEQSAALTKEDFADAEWIVREIGSGTREVFDDSVLKDMPNASIRMTLGHNQTVLKVTANGLGLCCLSRLAVEPRVQLGELVVLDTPFWVLKRTLYILSHKQKYQSPGLKRFLDFCQTT